MATEHEAGLTNHIKLTTTQTTKSKNTQHMQNQQDRKVNRAGAKVKNLRVEKLKQGPKYYIYREPQ